MKKPIDTKTAAELKQLKRLERDYARLKEEHEILKKPSGSVPNKKRNLLVHRAEPGQTERQRYVPGVWGDTR